MPNILHPCTTPLHTEHTRKRSPPEEFFEWMNTLVCIIKRQNQALLLSPVRCLGHHSPLASQCTSASSILPPWGRHGNGTRGAAHPVAATAEHPPGSRLPPPRFSGSATCAATCRPQTERRASPAAVHQSALTHKHGYGLQHATGPHRHASLCAFPTYPSPHHSMSKGTTPAGVPERTTPGGPLLPALWVAVLTRRPRPPVPTVY